MVDRPISTHYFPTLYQHKYELEDGRTVRGGPVRYNYDDSIFPGYSWRGYCVLSRIQVSHVMSIHCCHMTFKTIRSGSHSAIEVLHNRCDAVLDVTHVYDVT